jgi:trk system potassium uptake protein TrkH
MLDLRPVGHVIGLLLLALGLTMIGPIVADLGTGHPNAWAFVESAVITCTIGGLVALATANGVGDRLNLRQVFLLTVLTWIVLPVFAAVPFMVADTRLGPVEALFESMSGLSTTGATMISRLQEQSAGINLWRGVLHWLGGLGIVIVAMVFLPVMRVGGMQFFQSEGFDTLGKVMPRALDIASELLKIYLILTAVAFATFAVLGMTPFEAAVHAFSVVSTGGFSTTDASFAAFPGAPQYACIAFMFAASIPFVRLFQLMNGEARPLFRDSQVRAYLAILLLVTLAIVFWRLAVRGEFSEPVFRETLFNVVSIMSGTGFSTTDVMAWGTFPFVLLIMVGAIGGCTSSTGCSIKVFRYQVLWKCISVQIRRLYSTRRVEPIRLDGRRLDETILNSVILLFVLYIVVFWMLAVGLSLTGLSFIASVTGAWTAVFNVGPAFGPEVMSSGSLARFPDAAKVLMTVGMLLGRLEIITVLVLLLPRFWRD